MISSQDADSERFPLVNPSIQRPIYVKAYPLRDPTDVPRIKAEIIEGNILIVKITPIAKRSIEETKSAISELVEFVKSIQGDIARLGPMAVCPSSGDTGSRLKHPNSTFR